MKLLKPWSISTTVRSPDRLRGFLSVLQQLEGARWNEDAQVSFQIRLLQARLFGAYSEQFYQGLPQEDIDLLESGRPISYQEAKNIFDGKEYETPPMRGRQSFKPLHKFGFVSIDDGHVRITPMGNLLLAETEDYGNVFLCSLLKWQLPNELEQTRFPEGHGYNVKPFVGFLRLLKAVNRLCAKEKAKVKGISFEEFGIFALALIDYRHIEKTAEEIMAFRRDLAGVPRARMNKYIKKAGERLRPEFNLRHRRDYTDNAIRYFRMTKYISLRGVSGNTYIDLEPTRKIELASLFKRDEASPIRDFAKLGGSYSAYLCSNRWPDLPGESDEELMQAIRSINDVIVKDGGSGVQIPVNASLASKQALRNKARAVRLEQLKEKERVTLQDPDKAASVIKALRELAARKNPQDMPPSLKLEHLTAKVLEQILNDAKRVRPNYPVDDGGTPTMTAPGGVADIECYYDEFDAICEVTMLADSKQWIHETQPIMRHLHSFAKGKEREVYCIFIAPKIHKDSFNIFRFSSLQGHEGMRQNIAPVSIAQFCDVADACIAHMRTKRRISSAHIRELLDAVCKTVRETETSDTWMHQVPTVIEKWKQAL